MLRCAYLLLLLLGCGCNIMGVAANAVAGGGTTPAAFTMEKRPTIVIAESYSNPGLAGSSSEVLAENVSADLSAHQVAPMIGPGEATVMRERDPQKWRSMTMAAVGRAVGAEQLLYIDVAQFDIETASMGQLLRGRAQVKVRLIDTKSGSTIWPAQMNDGYAISAETAYRNMAQSSEAAIREELVRTLAARTAVLFYEVKHD